MQRHDEVCTLTGDVSESGESAAFRLLDETRRACGYGPSRSTVLLGNHDLRGRATFMKRFGKELREPRVLANGEIQLITLDSTVYGLAWAHNPYGRLDKADFEYLESRLTDRREVVSIVALHHHVADVPDEDRWAQIGRRTRWVGLRRQFGPVDGASRLLDIVCERGVAAVLSGHVHGYHKHVRRRGRRSVTCYIAGATKDNRCFRIFDIAAGRLREAGWVHLCRVCDHLGAFECDSCGDNGEIDCESCGGAGVVCCGMCEGADPDCRWCDDDFSVECDDCAGIGILECADCEGTREVPCEACT